MQMWIIWMLWGVFMAVMFGLITDAVSESKGYAKSWFYAGLFLGPIGLLILLLRPDPAGQVRYVENRPEVIARSRAAEASKGTKPGSDPEDAGADTAAEAHVGMNAATGAGVNAELNAETNAEVNTEVNTGINETINEEVHADPYQTEEPKAAGYAAEEEADDSASRWICPLCGHKNLKGISWCDACGNAKK